MDRVEHVRQRQPAAAQAATITSPAPLDAVHTTLGAVGNTTALAALLDGDDLDGWGALVTDATTLSLAGITPHAGPAQGSNQATLAVMRLARAEGVNHAALASLRLGGGRPLPPAILARVNAVFGADFSHVRLHQDAAAARMTEAAQARAFTVGHEIWFNAGELDLGTPEGVDLLLHELTHVMQHDEGRLPSGPGLSVSSPSDPHEQEAERVAASLAPAWESASWAEDPSLVGEGLFDDAAWSSAVDAGPASAEGLASRAEDDEARSLRPSVQGVTVGQWTDSGVAKLIGGAELAPPTPGQLGFPSRGEAVAWAGASLADAGADGAVIVRGGDRFFAFGMSVESWLYDFTAENVTSGLAEDSLHADGAAVPGIEGFVTVDGVFVVPHTFTEVEASGEVLGGINVLSGDHTSVPTESDLAELAAMARSDAALPLNADGAVALFKGLLKSKALARLRENRAALEEMEARYAPGAEGSDERWAQLDTIMEIDELLAREEGELEAALAGISIPMPLMLRLMLSNPGMLTAEELERVSTRLQEVQQLRDRLQVEVPELATLSSADRTALQEERYAGMRSRIADATASMDDVSQRVLTEDIPLTKLGPIVQDTLTELNLTPERATAGHTLSADVLDWIAGEELEEQIITLGGTALTLTLTIGAILASGGWLAVLGVSARAAQGIGLAGAAVGFGEAGYSFERADDLNVAAQASGAGAPNALVDDPDAARFNYVMAWLNLGLAALDLGLFGKSMTGGRVVAQLSDLNEVHHLRAAVSRRIAGTKGLELKYTDDELLQILLKGRESGLSEQEIVDLVFIASRDAKRRTAAELMEQMDHILAFRARGYPAHFKSKEEFESFGAAFKQEVSKLGISADDIRVQGSAVRTPDADDLDLAVMISEDNFVDIVRGAFNNKIKVQDAITKEITVVDMAKMGQAELDDLIIRYRSTPEQFVNKSVIDDFAYVYGQRVINAKGMKRVFKDVFDAKSVLTSMKARFPHLKFDNISFQAPNGSFDLHPYFPVP
jgi:hypothetical protein